MATVTINGEEYDLDDLSDAAKGHLGSIRYCESEINRCNVMVAALQTAKYAYGKALVEEIGKESDDQPKITIPENLSFD